MAFRNPLQNIESQNPVSGGPAIGQMADSAIEPIESTAEWTAVETKLRQPIASVPQQASAGEDRFSVPKIKVSNDEYKLLYNMLSSKSTKAEMNEQEARMYSAMTFAENMDIPFSYAYDNLNSLTKAWNGIEFKPTVSNATAIHNSFQIGPLSRKQANIAYNLMMSGDITDEERQSMIQQLEALDKEIEPLIDDMPRPWYVEMLKSAGQSMMYSLSGMTEGAKGALAGSSAALASLSLAGISLGGLSTVALGPVALPAAALAAGTGLATSMAFQFADTMKAEAGALYWDLLKQGVDDSTAKTVSMIHGGASGSIELWLDGLLKPVLKALDIPVDDFVSDFMTNMIWKGSYSDMAKAGMEFATRTVTGAAGEGVEEVLQGISGNLMTAIAATLSDTAVEEADWNVFRDFADDFAGGFLSSIVLGAPFNAYNSYITVRDAQYLKDAAPAYSSRESYGKAMSTLKPEELTDADWDTVLDSAYKKGNEEARSSFERSYASLSDEIEKRRKTALDLSAGEDEEAASDMADGKVVRNDDGSLSASISRGVRIGNRTSNIYTARSAGKDGTLYGYAAYSIDNRNNTLDITSVKMAEPYSGLRQEMITQLIQSYPEMEIRWDAMSVEDQNARQAIIDANPNGADKGLSYGKIMSADERADLNAVKERLGNYFSDEDAVNSALATIIQIQGAKEGISGIRFLDKYLRFKGTDEMTDEELSRLGNSRGAITFSNIQDVKATILASSKADPTTFMHEMSHLLRRIGNNGDEFAELFERMKSKESFRQFVATNKLILNKDIDNLFTARDEDGNIVWGRAEDEFFAQLAEAYFKNGETYSGMKGFFKRMADWFKMVYRSIRQSAPMNEEIIRFYDNLFYGTGRDEQQNDEELSDSGNAVVKDEGPIIYYQGSKDRSVSDLTRDERAQLAIDIDMGNIAGSGADSITLHQTDILSLRNDLEELAASYDDFDEFKVNAILMFDSDEFPMDDKVLQEAFDNAHAAVDDNESPENPTLKTPNRMILGEDEKDEQFVRLIRESDSELDEFISELRRAANDPESYPEVSRAIDFEVAPIIRNVIFPASKERAYMRDTMRAQRKAESIFEETMDDEKAQKELRRTGLNEEESKNVVNRSIRGIIASSPAFYRELYAKASENSYWMPLATLPEYVNDYLPENFSSYTIAEKRKVLSEIENDLLKKRILSGEEPYSNGYLEELITSQDDKIASANSEISKLKKEMEDISGKYKTSEIKLGVAWKNLQDTETELGQAKEKIREISEKIAKKASGDTYNSIPQTLVDAKQNLAKQISQLSKQQESYLRQFLRDDASKKISDAVYKQRYADAKRMNDLRKKHDQKIKDLKALYKEKESLRKVKEYKQKLADAIMREPGKGVSIDYADKILAIQALIDPAERSRMMIPSGKDKNGKTIYSSWSIDKLKEMFRGQVAKDPYVFSLLTPSQLERLSKVSLDEMTVSDLENLAVTVNQLRQEGMQERRAYVEAERSRIRTIQNQLYSTVMGSGKYSGTYMAQSAEEKKDRKRWRGIYSSPIYYATVNMARKAQMLDGDKKGLFYDVLIRMKRDAQAVETKAIRSRQEAVGKVMEEHGITYADMYSSVDVEFPSGTERYTISQLAYVYLSKNNERNRQAIAYGTLVNSVEKDQIRRGVEARIKGDTLEAAEERRRIINDEVRNLGDYRYDVLYDAAKRTIEGNADILAAVRAVEADFNSSGFDRVVDMMKNVYNQRVEREMYYLPNSRIGFIGTEPAEKIKQDILNQIPGTKGSVDKGFTMSRIDISPVNQSEIELDLFSVWQDSVFEQEHALANVEYVRLLNGIFINRSSEALRTAISDAYGNGMMAAIDQHIKEISNPKMKTEKSAADQLIRTLRGNLYSAYLGYKPSSVILQAITSPAAFSAVLSPYQMLKAYMTSIFRFPSIWKEIQQLSPFMVSRSYHVIVGEMKEELAKANLSRFKRAGLRFHEIGQMGLEFIDRFCVGTGWWALYQKELSSIMEEGSITDAELAKKEAARRADEFVSETQPLSDITELSPMFKNKSEALNTLLAFQSSLNVIWQNVTYDIPAAVKNQEYKKALGMAVGYMVAGALLTIVKDGLKGDDDDKDKPEWWQSILYGSTTQLVAGIPAISSAVDGVVKHVITGEDDSFMLRFNDNYPAVTKLLLGVHKALDGKWADAVSSVSEGMALILGLPVSMSKETIRTAGYIADGEYGKAAGSIVGRRYD